MTVVVSFIRGAQISQGASGVSSIRAQERLAIGATTVNSTQVGDTVLIGNGEAGMIAAAFGSAPDAAAVDNSTFPVTSAGMPIAAGTVGIPIVPGAGYKINVKAVP